ncbi:hypothetical protein DFH28DRAFT_899020 [Melampsora americana]|nr:hypothetical protein DFH28DRAFT_899020 [Melampsora americana]
MEDIINQTTINMEPIKFTSNLKTKTYIYQMLISFSLISIQALLLHPTFIKSRLAKYLRIGLTPINFYLFISSPFRNSSRLPESFDVFQKIGFGSTSIIFAIRSLEYGFAKTAYYTRSIEKSKDELLLWNQIKDSNELKRLRKSQEEENVKFAKLFFWTILNLTSFRGLQFTFGPTMKANNSTLKEMLKRLIKVSIPFSLSFFIILQTHRSPLQTPISALTSFGIPNFKGLSLILELIHRISFGISLSTSIDLQYTILTILLHLLYHFLIQFNLSNDFLELINPIYYPPLFDSPHKSSSLNDLWSNRWHLLLKRSFLTLGGKPTFWFFNQILGFNVQISKIAGLFGTFIASGILHEYGKFLFLNRV